MREIVVDSLGEDFRAEMWEMMENRKVLYTNLIDDLYYLGVELGQKYFFLRMSFNVFMYGIILSVTGFLICHIMF